MGQRRKAYCVTIRDIPEAITQGETEEEALSMAAAALLSAMDFAVWCRRPRLHAKASVW
jgi:antitoxin HicB